MLVTGGVVSGLGKGVTASGIGVLLKGCGFRVTSIKIGELAAASRWGRAPAVRRAGAPTQDPPRPRSLSSDPYLNTDAGTMSPFEHGEVFVLDDGGEVRAAAGAAAAR